VTKTNVVVGGASGMGEAIANALSADGPLIVADSDLDGAHRVAAAVWAEAVECDVTSPVAVEALAGRVASLGALVITAGVSPQIAETGAEVLEVNLVGTARVLQAFERALGPGSVGLCFASIAARRPSVTADVLAVLSDPLEGDLVPALRGLGLDVDDRSTAYALSKLGVIALVRRLAPSWGARGARILSLSPGVIDTPMGRRAVDELPAVQAAIPTWPIARLGSPAEVAQVAAFLCSHAASYMTGSDVLVDGGSVAGYGTIG
jgi:NAD(P)-dependent dehydrogenase (short-subunit alcohol dehydrogenase family)